MPQTDMPQGPVRRRGGTAVVAGIAAGFAVLAALAVAAGLPAGPVAAAAIAASVLSALPVLLSPPGT